MESKLNGHNKRQWQWAAVAAAEAAASSTRSLDKLAVAPGAIRLCIAFSKVVNKRSHAERANKTLGMIFASQCCDTTSSNRSIALGAGHWCAAIGVFRSIEVSVANRSSVQLAERAAVVEIASAFSAFPACSVVLFTECIDERLGANCLIASSAFCSKVGVIVRHTIGAAVVFQEAGHWVEQTIARSTSKVFVMPVFAQRSHAFLHTHKQNATGKF